MTINFARTLRTSDNVADRVIEALWTDPFVPAAALAVHVFDGAVLLTGEVASEAERIAVGRLVADLACVDRLTNAVTVARSTQRYAA